MQTTVFVNLSVDGFHCWPDAPDDLAFLREKHFHQFKIRAEVAVRESREVEFFKLRNECLKWWYTTSPSYAPNHELGADVDSMSCEQLATALMVDLRAHGYHAISVTVQEDDMAGATVSEA